MVAVEVRGGEPWSVPRAVSVPGSDLLVKHRGVVVLVLDVDADIGVCPLGAVPLGAVPGHHLQQVLLLLLPVPGGQEDVPGGSVDREDPTVVLHAVVVVGRVVLVPGGHAGHKPGQLLPILYPWLVLPVLSSSVSFSTCS